MENNNFTKNKRRVQSMRLKYWNYSENGYYFVTICAKNKIEYFGKIKNGKMILNEYGKIAKKYWIEIPKHFLDVKIDEFVIMPNHIHGIIIIKNIVGGRHACHLHEKRQYQKFG